MDDCCCRVNHGTSGGDSKENARCLSNAEYGDKGNEKRGRNDEDGLHGGVCVKRGLDPLVSDLGSHFRDQGCHVGFGLMFLAPVALDATSCISAVESEFLRPGRAVIKERPYEHPVQRISFAVNCLN